MLMTPEQFAQACMAMPAMRWVKWAADWERRQVDCYGLLVLFERMVHGVEIGPVPQTDIAAGFSSARGWVQCEPQPGATAWMAFDRTGAPKHCGVLLDAQQVLHAEGDEDRGGAVRITRLAALRRLYGDIRFYRRAAC